MTMNRRPIAVTAVLCFALGSGCRQQQASREPQPPATEATPATGSLRTLTSGKQVRVVATRQDQGPPAVMDFEYATDIPFREHARLASEVEEVWADIVRKEAESAHATRVYILPRTGPASEDRTTGFVYKRDEDGSWSKAGGFPPSPPR